MKFPSGATCLVLDSFHLSLQSHPSHLAFFPEKLFCPLASGWVWPMEGTGQTGRWEQWEGSFTSLTPCLEVPTHRFHPSIGAPRLSDGAFPHDSLLQVSYCFSPHPSGLRMATGPPVVSLHPAHTFERNPFVNTS